MKNFKFIPGLLLAGLLALLPLTGCTKKSASADAKPYPLDTSIVSGKPLGSTPFTFVFEGQQIKVCDEAEKGEFDKSPGIYLRKLAEAEAEAKTQKQ